MAEIQFVVEVRCVNTLLAEFKVDEKGQHIAASVPNRDLDPHEFDKLIEGAETAARLAKQQRGGSEGPQMITSPASFEVELGTVSAVAQRTGQYQMQVLKTGEIISLNLPGSIFGPSELDQFIQEMRIVQSRFDDPA